MLNDVKVQKSTCERYDLRWDRFGWATFAIDEAGGIFNCQSDHGNYNHHWPHHGRKTFKHFLIELARDPQYLMEKVSEKTYFNFDANLGEWKRTVLQMRKDKELTKEQAKDVWDFLRDELGDYSRSPEIIQKEIYEHWPFNAIINEPWYCFEVNLDYPPEAHIFAKEVMPMFADVLKKELGAEMQADK